MAIYDYDSNIVADQLTPPVLRNSKFLAWLYVLVSPIQNRWSLIFNDYKIGNVYSDFNVLTTYNFGDRIRWTDKAIYEATYTNSLGVAESFNGVYPSDILFWTKVNDIFIGTDERVKYSAQKILFESALNTFFVTSGIYITNNFVSVGNVFVMDSTSAESSFMSYSNDSQDDYMDLTATYSTDTFDYTIFVPLAFHTSLGINASTIISTFADKYNLAGMQFNVLTY